MIFHRKTFECYVTMTVLKPLVIKCSKAEAIKTTVSIFYFYFFSILLGMYGVFHCGDVTRSRKTGGFLLQKLYKLFSQASFKGLAVFSLKGKKEP